MLRGPSFRRPCAGGGAASRTYAPASRRAHALPRLVAFPRGLVVVLAVRACPGVRAVAHIRLNGRGILTDCVVNPIGTQGPITANACGAPAAVDRPAALLAHRVLIAICQVRRPLLPCDRLPVVRHETVLALAPLHPVRLRHVGSLSAWAGDRVVAAVPVLRIAGHDYADRQNRHVDRS